MATPMEISSNDTTSERPADWRALWLREIRHSRRLKLHVVYAREQRQALREALRAAVAVVADLSRQLDRSRATVQALRDENRRIVRAKFTDDTHMPETASDGASMQVVQ